jgi:hypothetical protein
MDKAAFAIATGSVLAIFMFCATILLVIKGGDFIGPRLGLLRNYFAGYTVTVKGAFIALGYSFFCGFIFGWLFAYLRNFFLALYVYRVKRKIEIKSLKQFLDYI